MRRIAALALAAMLAYGQQAGVSSSSTAASTGVFRVTSTLVQVDAVVTDSKGRHVTDLTADDFEVLVDGKPQKITHFAHVNLSPPPIPDEPQAARAYKRAGSSQLDVPPPEPLTIRREDVRRTVVLMVDDLGLSWEDMAGVRRALFRFVDKQMQPGDLVAICRTAAGNGNLQQFTTDKRILKEVVDGLHYDLRDRGSGGLFVFEPFGEQGPLAQAIENNNISRTSQPPGTDLGPFFGSPDNDPSGISQANRVVARPDSLDDLRRLPFETPSLAAIIHIVDALHNMPGRKSLVLFSDGMLLNETMDPELKDLLRKLFDRANRSGTVIYTMDARGLNPLQMEAQDSVIGTAGPQGPGLPANPPGDPARRLVAARDREFQASQQGLAYLAIKTGGLPYENGNDLNWGLARVLKDQEDYYLLGFSPSPGLFKEAGGSRSFHHLSVQVDRQGLHVRTRSGFFGATDEEIAPKSEDRLDQMRAAMFDPFAKAEIRLRLTALYADVPKHGQIVRNLIHVDARDLKLEKQPDGSLTGNLDVIAAAYGTGDNPLATISKTSRVQVPAAQTARILRDGLVYVIDVPVKTPGPYQIRTAIRDAAEGKMGTAYQYLEVPNLKKTRLALTSIVLENGGLGSPDSSPVGVAAATREFPRGAELDYFSMVERGRRRGSEDSANLDAQIRIIHDGKEMYSAPAKLTAAGGRQTVLGKLKLNDAIPPGLYYLQVVAVDRTQPKNAIASQWTDFQVMP